MADLSPAAQAVFDAVWREIDYAPELHVRWAAIAALRAAADQVVPGQQNYDETSHELATACLSGMAYAANKLRAIAAELEAHQ